MLWDLATHIWADGSPRFSFFCKSAKQKEKNEPHILKWVVMQQDFLKSYRSTQWQEKKNKILTRDNYTCAICGKHGDEHTLMHVHHLTYKNCKDGKAWNCPDEDLVTLCEDCHNAVHSSYPSESVTKNFNYLKRLFSILGDKAEAYRFSFYSVYDGMLGCIEKLGKNECVLIHNGKILPFTGEKFVGIKLVLGEPEISLSENGKTLPLLIDILRRLALGYDAFDGVKKLIKIFAEEISWTDSQTDDTKRCFSVLLANSLFDDIRIYQLLP